MAQRHASAGRRSGGSERGMLQGKLCGCLRRDHGLQVVRCTRAHVLAHCLLRAAACSRTNTAPWTGTHPHSCTCTRLRAHSHQWADRAVPVRCEGAPQLTSSGANRPRASARSDYWRCSSCSRSLTPWGSRSRPGLARAGTFGGSTGRPRPGLRGPGAFSRRRDLTGNKIRWPKLVEDLHEHGDGSDTM